MHYISLTTISKPQVRKGYVNKEKSFMSYHLIYLEKRSTKELQNTTPINASSFCKSAYFINNGTKVVGIFENEICRFDLEVSQCSLK